jgi:hypothetical protein
MPITFDTRIRGIPCQVEVVVTSYTKPNPNTWASDWDFYGGYDYEYKVLDRNGRPARWLEHLMDGNDIAKLEDEINEHLESATA